MPGTTLDPQFVLDVAVESNRVHKTLGTELLEIRSDGVTIALRPERIDGAVPNAVMACLLDHACALAALVALDDAARFGGTMSLRVEYLRPAATGEPLHVAGECHHRTESVAHVRATAFHPGAPERAVAIAAACVAVTP